MNIGGLYPSLGDNEKALTYLNQALPLLRYIGNRRGEAMALHNMGCVYANIGKKQDALEYFTQAFRLLQEIGDQQGAAVTFIWISKMLSEMA